MLIKCPECENNISDKAISCPMCGYPMQSQKTASTSLRPYKKKRKYKRLPNGMGSIQKMSGRREKPYAVYPPTKAYHINGSAVRQKAIGYYADWHEAYNALVKYNKAPESVQASTLTFADIYELYYEEKYVSGKKTLSESARRSTQVAFKNCKVLHKKKFATLVASDLQGVVDNCTLKHSSLELIVSLIKGMYKYAIKNNLVEKDYSQYITINIPDDDERGEPFSDEELNILWKNSDDLTVQMILIMIYSGFRIKAFEDISINLADRYFQGGVKTAAGKNRIVPIHNAVYDFVTSPECLINDFSAGSFRIGKFYPTLKELGIYKTSNGKTHTPHDCRHTFSWLCDKYRVDDVSKHMLMGHSLGGGVEKSVYAHRTIKELRTEIDKIQVPKKS